MSVFYALVVGSLRMMPIAILIMCPFGLLFWLKEIILSVV